MVILEIILYLFRLGIMRRGGPSGVTKKNRDLFPQKHFVTLSPRGIAGHFAAWQIPFRGRNSIELKNIQSVESGKVGFLPTLPFGICLTYAVVVSSINGEKVFMPFYGSHEMGRVAIREIEAAIDRVRQAS